MFNSQPLNSKLFDDLDIDNLKIDEHNIRKQYMGRMIDSHSDIKITIGDRLRWFKCDIRGVFYDIKYTLRNYFKWAKTIAKLRPWDGWESGVLVLMQKHLEDYVDTEIKYGHSEESFKQGKIESAQECINILKRLQNPMEYSSKLLEPVYARYPKYNQLVTKYNNSTSFSGLFIQQDDIHWVGQESGKDPRIGCFKFIDGLFTLVNSPNSELTIQLLDQLDSYNKEITLAYELANKQYEQDKTRMAQILVEHGPSWWD